MNKLIKAEYYKLQKFPSFRIIFSFVFAIGIFRGLSYYQGYHVYIVGVRPELFDAVLISVFTAAFLSTEFTNHTFSNAYLCAASRQRVFLAKLAAYFLGLLLLVLVPLAVSTIVATVRNGFGADFNTVALEIIEKLIFYILCRFSMAGFAILSAVIIRNTIGTLGVSLAGIYLMSIFKNPVENPIMCKDMIFYIITITVFLFAAGVIFIRRDLK